MEPVSSSPNQLVVMLRDLRKDAAVETFTLDRCPRCPLFTAFESKSIKSAADLLEVWGITKATEQSRADLYVSYAVESARGGELERARDVALEAVGHVSLEDARLHLLLGQIAVALADPVLLREARQFLRFFRLIPWELKLYEVETSGTPDFADPE